MANLVVRNNWYLPRSHVTLHLIRLRLTPWILTHFLRPLKFIPKPSLSTHRIRESLAEKFLVTVSI